MKRTAVTAALAAALAGLAAVTLAHADSPDPVARGRYLVTAGGCNDCHTPWKMGQAGPEPDLTRLLSGHPAALPMPPAPAPQGAWMITASATMTAWSGPWGVSFAANLTPDDETGLGRWKEKEFVETLRTGRHLARGRPLLPPMPVQNTAQLTEDDLRAIYAYLRTVPAVRNRVPEPIAPAAVAAPAAPASEAARADAR
jgi:mono/diheme cytochrome c family protein